jgi:gluconolactonase
MKNKKTRILRAAMGSLACLVYLSAGAAETEGAKRPDEIYDPQGLIAESELMTIAGGFKFTEGPAADRDGNVYFTDQPNDRIHRWDARTNKVTVFLEGTGRANGMAMDADGNLLACTDMHGQLWKIAPDGKHEVLVDNYQGKRLNGPNDVWVNPVNGGIYITDPIFPRDYWDADDPRRQSWPPRRSEQAAEGKGGYVYYLAPGNRELVRVTTEAMGWESDAWPNGVVGTPDGKTLYVNKWHFSNKGGTFAFDINADGTLSNMRKVTEWGGDGMSMDERGNIYISNSEGVLGFDPQGNHILKIPIKGGTTNSTFAGPDGKTLFITGSGDKVLSIRMNVRGAAEWASESERAHEH